MNKIINNKYFPFILFAVLLLILLINNWSLTLIDQDEAAYAGFGKNMLEQGNLLIPNFTWSEVHRKPPLLFWLITFSYKIFGINEFALRLPVTIAIFLVYLLVYFQGKYFFGKETASLATIILGTSLFIPTLGKFAYTDGLLLLFHTLAGFSLLHIIKNKSYKWVAVFWFAFAMGLLTKGPPIMIFTGFMVILLFIFHKKRWNLIIIHPWFGLPIAFLPLFFWGYQAWQIDNGEFIKWMLDWYILERVNNSVFGQTGPPGYFLATFLVFFIPYLCFIPSAIGNSFKALKNRNKEFLILLAWLASGWLFYEFLPSKLPTYVIASYPALALIIAKQIVITFKEQKKFLLIKISSIFQLILTIGISVGIIIGVKMLLPSINLILAVIIAASFTGGTSVAIFYFWKKKYQKATIFFVGNATIFLLLIWTFLMPKIDELKNSTERVSYFIQKNANPESTIVIANSSRRPPSLPFYLWQKNKDAKIIENYDPKFILKKYKSYTAYVFVLSEQLFNKIKEKQPKIQASEIKSLSTEQTDMTKYFVIINKNN